MDGIERAWYLSGAYAEMIRGEKPHVYSGAPGYDWEHDPELEEVEALNVAQLRRIRKAAVNFYKRYMEAERKHIVSKRAILFLYDTRAYLLEELDQSDFAEEE